jgi:hypothetical protein
MADITTKQFEKAASELDAKDKKFVSKTEGGIPVTKAEEIIGKNRKSMEPVAEALSAPFQMLGNLLAPGKPFGKSNPFVASQQELDARAIELQNLKAYREKRDTVRDNVVNIIHRAKEKYPDMNQQQAAELDADIQAYIRSMGLSQKDFTTITPSTLLMEDEFGLYSSTPNPYPMVEVGGEMVAGTVGMLKGFKAGPALIDAFGDSYRYGTKGIGKRFMAGMARGGKVPGPWWAKALGAVIGGAMGVGIADYGYEVQLDIMNKAGTAKKFLKNSDNQILETMSAAIPERLTFGPEGINRPDQVTRIKGALKDAAIDGAISSVFFGARPAYYATKRFVGGNVFGMFKPRAGSRVPAGQEILDAEQRLYQSGKFNEIFKEDALTKEFIETSIGGRQQNIQFNFPLIGNIMTRLMRSPIFNFLSPAELKTPLKQIGDLLPQTEKMIGTNVQRSDVGSPMLAGISKLLGRAPVIGTRIYRNKADQMNAYMDLGGSIIQKLTFAPILNVSEHGAKISGLGGAAARGFRDAAAEKQQLLLDAARKYGAVVDDSTLVGEAKRIYQRALAQRQVVPTEGGTAAVSKAVPEPFIDFLKTQIIDPGVAGARTIEGYYGLRDQMDKLYNKFLKNADGESQADILNIYKAWEADIGNLSKSGIPEVEKLWRDYEKFVSNGMMMFTTKAGKAVAGPVERFGMAINIDPDRQATNIFETVIDIAKKDPGNAATNLATMKNIVGDKAYYEGLGIYLNKVFNNSIVQRDGAELFDGEIFRRALGLGKGNPLKTLFEKALPGPQVSKIVVRDGQTGIVKEFDNVNFNEGLKAIKYETPAGIAGKQAAQLPNLKDLEDFATLMTAAAANGIPEISTFMARRAVMGGIRSGIASALPTSALGIKTKTLGAGALAAFGSGWLIPAALAYGVRYMGGIITSPPSLRAYRNILNDTLPEQVRLANFVRLVRLRPEEWQEFDRELAEVEKGQRYREQVGQTMAPARSTMEILGEAGKDLLDKGKGAADTLMGTPGESPAMNILDRIQNPPQPDSNYFADEVSSIGSSILQNPNMNPAAAASLYEGNLDQALANRVAPRMAARGGIISLVS